ncbi:unnamed protein product, partial [Amoebophrya sp. A120]
VGVVQAEVREKTTAIVLGKLTDKNREVFMSLLPTVTNARKAGADLQSLRQIVEKLEAFKSVDDADDVAEFAKAKEAELSSAARSVEALDAEDKAASTSQEFLPQLVAVTNDFRTKTGELCEKLLKRNLMPVLLTPFSSSKTEEEIRAMLLDTENGVTRTMIEKGYKHMPKGSRPHKDTVLDLLEDFEAVYELFKRLRKFQERFQVAHEKARAAQSHREDWQRRQEAKVQKSKDRHEQREARKKAGAVGGTAPASPVSTSRPRSQSPHDVVLKAHGAKKTETLKGHTIERVPNQGVTTTEHYKDLPLYGFTSTRDSRTDLLDSGVASGVASGMMSSNILESGFLEADAAVVPTTELEISGNEFLVARTAKEGDGAVAAEVEDVGDQHTASSSSPAFQTSKTDAVNQPSKALLSEGSFRNLPTIRAGSGRGSDAERALLADQDGGTTSTAPLVYEGVLSDGEVVKNTTGASGNATPSLSGFLAGSSTSGYNNAADNYLHGNHGYSGYYDNKPGVAVHLSVVWRNTRAERQERRRAEEARKAARRRSLDDLLHAARGQYGAGVATALETSYGGGANATVVPDWLKQRRQDDQEARALMRREREGETAPPAYQVERPLFSYYQEQDDVEGMAPEAYFEQDDTRSVSSSARAGRRPPGRSTSSGSSSTSSFSAAASERLARWKRQGPLNLVAAFLSPGFHRGSNPSSSKEPESQSNKASSSSSSSGKMSSSVSEEEKYQDSLPVRQRKQVLNLNKQKKLVPAASKEEGSAEEEAYDYDLTMAGGYEDDARATAGDEQQNDLQGTQDGTAGAAASFASRSPMFQQVVQYYSTVLAQAQKSNRNQKTYGIILCVVISNVKMSGSGRMHVCHACLA